MSDNDPVDEMLRATAQAVTSPSANLEDLDRRRRADVRRRRVGGAIGGGAVGIGVVVALLAALAHQPSGERSGSDVKGSILRITCEAGEATVSSDEVVPWSDGVHVEVVNPSSQEISIVLGSGSRHVPPGTRSFVLETNPGPLSMSCDVRKKVEVVAHVVDQAGVFVDPPLWCGDDAMGVGQGEGIDVGNADEDPIDLIETLPTGVIPNVRPGDQFRQVGYLDDLADVHILVVRDGRNAAVVDLSKEGGSWSYTGQEYCPE